MKRRVPLTGVASFFEPCRRTLPSGMGKSALKRKKKGLMTLYDGSHSLRHSECESAGQAAHALLLKQERTLCQERYAFINSS